MSPIKGLSEQKRLPRLGKIHLGVKKKSPRTGGEYPVATDYFVCPPDVTRIYGEKPKQLDIIVPIDDEEVWANQYYRQYSRTRGLVCKGDGVTCRRMVDIATGNVAGKDTKEIAWRENLACDGKECPDYKGKACQEVMNLQVMLPKVPGLGIWQIDTGSVHSIMNINNCATMIRAMCGTVAWIPLVLSLEPTEVNNPDDGKKKTVWCMSLRYEGTAGALLSDSAKPHLQILLAAPIDDEAPVDRLLTAATPEKYDELNAKVTDDIAELWGGEPVLKSLPVTPPAKSEPVVSAGSPEPLDTAQPVFTETILPNGINLDHLKGALNLLQWADVGKHLTARYGVKGKKVSEMVELLSREQAEEFVKEVERRLDEVRA